MDIVNLGSINLSLAVRDAIMKNLASTKDFDELMMCVSDEIKSTCNKKIENLNRPVWKMPSAVLDMLFGKIKDKNYGFHGAGIASAADSLAAVKKYVYDEKSLTLERLIAALDTNYENDPELLHLLCYEAPKMGNDDDYVDELAEKIKKSANFLEEVGGITLSGGEPLFQWEFALELIRELKPLDIAIETSGYADSEHFKAVISECDFVMIDIKLSDRDAHKKYTGVYNDKILENLNWLKKSGKPFLIRTPLIPGITDTDENLAGIAKIADGHPVELLPYNDLAGSKYQSVGKKYTELIKEKKSRIKDTTELPDNFRIR